MIESYISSLGFQVTRRELRESIQRVDPEGIELRKKKPIRRREYSVPGPHYLWHQDGNHKLIRWGIVIHGCIDGFSRSIIYLAARDNNTSKAVFDLFKDGLTRYQLPDRVRGDKGGENILVAEYMLQHRGLGRSSYIAGSSKHNTRIERLWRDMRQHTIQSYIDLFTSLEAEGMQLNNLLHIYSLQYLFIPVINEALQLFVDIWNNHKISTEQNRSPNQLLIEYAGNTAIAEDIHPETIGIVETDDDSDGHEVNVTRVNCDPIECPLTDDQLVEFRNRIQPLTLHTSFDEFTNAYRGGLNIMKDIFYREG
jgi:hypothetical protein